MITEFSRIDFNDLPEDGLYWLLVEREEVDIDADDSGNTVGRPTGGSERLVTLGFVEFGSGPDDMSVDIVDPANYPACEPWEIIAVAEVKTPSVPDIL